MPNNFFVLFLVACLTLPTFSTATAEITKRDDFQDYKSWWVMGSGCSSPAPSILDGVVYLTLTSASRNSSCGTYLADDNIHQYYTATMRVKTLTPMRPGSRGWGFWDYYPPFSAYEHADADISWFMEQYDPFDSNQTWWLAGTRNGDTGNYNFSDLNSVVDPSEWHTYKIIRQADFVAFYVDDVLVHYSDSALPDAIQTFHLWVDNFVYPFSPTSPITHRDVNQPNTLICDFVEISDGQIGSSEVPVGSMLLKEMPNEMGSGRANYLWKNYDFHSPGGKTLVLLTARAESYGDFSDDDDIRLVVDTYDLEWDTENSFNGDILNGENRSLVYVDYFTEGNHSLDIYGDITPLLYDVTVIGATYGDTILNQELNERAPGGNNYQWKRYQFQCAYDEEVIIYISATAHENSSDDDDIRVTLDNEDFGWDTANAFSGDQLHGEAKALTIRRNLSQGNHTLTLYADRNPTLHNVIIYGSQELLPTNSAPVLDPIGNQSVNEGDTLNFIVSGTDPDDDNMTFTATNLPSGASIDPVTGVFSFTPGYDQAGTYSGIEITVTDDGTPQLSDSETITITVNECTIDDVTCDGIDDDCDGTADEDYGTQPTTCGIGACASTGTSTCEGGAVIDTCTAGEPAANDATCDGIDDDCDGTADEDYGTQPSTCGIGACASTGAISCVDGSVTDTCTPMLPTTEICDGIDNDCDTYIDDDDPDVTGQTTWYADFDSDTYGDPNAPPQSACDPPAGYVADNTDCNDENASINPGATDDPDNGVDENCVDTPPVADAGSDQSVQTGETVTFDGGNSTDDVGIMLYEWDFDSDGTYDASGITPTASHIYDSAGTYAVTLRVTDTASQTAVATLTVTVETPGTSSELLESGTVTVGGDYQTVNLENTYVSPIVVCTIQYQNNTIPVVSRVNNVTSTNFDVRLQNPSGNPVAAENVSYLVVEEGVWTIDGVNIEAQKYVSTVTDENNSWVGEPQTFGQNYTNPVVIGQVMTENDARWSVFWCRGSSQGDPPSSTVLRTGKTVCEDSDTDRTDETIGFIVIEAGHGTTGGIEYEAKIGNNSVGGVTNSPPYTYNFDTVFDTIPQAAVATMAGVNGGNGGWAYIYGSTLATTSSLFLSIDEDQIGDSERNHISEQVGYIVFGPSTNPPPSNQPPTAVASGDPTNGTAPLEVSFTGSNSFDDDGTVASYVWDFGDGNGSSLPDPTHTYQSTGSYTAVLTVTDNDNATDTAQVTITVITPANQPPTAVASGEPTSGTAPLAVSFMGSGSFDNDGMVTSYAWDFGDGNGSSLPDPTHTYQNAGTFTAVLTVTDNNDTTDTAMVEITVTGTTPGDVMHVNAIEVTKQTLWIFRSGTSRVQVVDTAGSPVENATVTGQWSGGASDIDQLVTGPDGWASTSSSWRWGDATFTFCVTNISKEGWEYDPDSNVISCQSSN